MATHTRWIALVIGLVCGASGIVAAPSAARAEVAGTNRVALVDSELLWAPGGIAAYREARAKLDAEKPGFKVAEHPTGKIEPLPDIGKDLDPETRKRFQQVLIEQQRKQVHLDAWAARENAVLEPIQAEVLRALEKYARARGIGLVLDRAEIGNAPIVVAAGVDITDAFIRDYNATAAKQKPAAAPAAPAPARPAAPAKPATK